MHAHVTLSAPDGRTVELVPGDLIGRVWSSILQINDARVSEAHAMVSLREGRLELIGLRGNLAVDGKPAGRVVLQPGLVVQLARGVDVEVLEVVLPERVMGLRGEGLLVQALPPVCSIVLDPGPRVVHGHRDDARATIWTTGEEWLLSAGGEASKVLRAGEVVDVGGHTVELVEVASGAAGQAPTRQQADVTAPLRVTAKYDSVHVNRGDDVPVTFSGKQAQLISELVACGGAVSWTALTEELWPDEPDAWLRRGRLDVLLTRIRRKLRASGVRTDLVRTSGAGLVELLLYPHDVVDDQT